MEATDLILVAVRWLHGSAAVLWVGGVLFELLALRPAIGDALSPTAQAGLDRALGEIVQSSLVAFLVTGALLTFDRLSHNVAADSYVAILGVKLLLSVAMFQVAFRSRRAVGARRTTGLRWVGGLGLLVMLLASLLKTVFERGLLDRTAATIMLESVHAGLQ